MSLLGKEFDLGSWGRGGRIFSLILINLTCTLGAAAQDSNRLDEPKANAAIVNVVEESKSEPDRGGKVDSLQHYLSDPNIKNLMKLTPHEVQSVVSSGMYKYMENKGCPQCSTTTVPDQQDTKQAIETAYSLLDDDGKMRVLQGYFHALTLRQRYMASDLELQTWIRQELDQLVHHLLTNQGLFGEALAYGEKEFQAIFCSQVWFNPHTTNAGALRKIILDHNYGYAIMNLKCQNDQGTEYEFKHYLDELVTKQNEAEQVGEMTRGPLVAPPPHRGPIVEKAQTLQCNRETVAKEMRPHFSYLNDPKFPENKRVEIWFEIKTINCLIVGALSKTNMNGFRLRLVPSQQGGTRGLLVARDDEELIRMLSWALGI